MSLKSKSSLSLTKCALFPATQMWTSVQSTMAGVITAVSDMDPGTDVNAGQDFLWTRMVTLAEVNIEKRST